MTKRQYGRIHHEVLFWVWLGGAGYLLYTLYKFHEFSLVSLFFFAVEIYMANYHKNQCEKFLTNKNEQGKKVHSEEDP
jgi:hypothetical protein